MCDQPAERQVLLRSFGAFVLVVGLIEFIVDLVVYNDLTSPKLGAWWAALLILITAFLAVLSTNRAVVVACCVFSIIAVIVGVIGCIVDGIANSVITSLKACLSSDGSLSGSSSYYTQVSNDCGIFTSNDCGCVQSGSDTCFFYNGGIAASDCDNVLTEYTHALHGAIAMDLIATFGVFALSIVTCVAVCCPTYAGGTTTVVTTPPVAGVVVGAPVTTQQAYPQQQYIVQQPAPQYAQQPAGYPLPQYGAAQYPQAAPAPGYPQPGYGGSPPVAQGYVVDQKNY